MAKKAIAAPNRLSGQPQWPDADFPVPDPGKCPRKLVNESLAYDDVLWNSGYLLANQALQSVHAATTILPREGKMLRPDGPFAETKEQIGGFILAARDLNEAIQLASGLPSVRLGGVEVRPIKELTNSSTGV
jgi:hypothetical protein